MIVQLFRRARSHTPWRRAGGTGSVLIAAALSLALLPAVAGLLPGPRTAVARADDVTASQDPLRTGWDRHEPKLSPSVVGGGSFGQVFSTAVSGQVYAQPLVIGSTVIVATENDWVYGLNAATGAVKWQLSLGTPWAITKSEDCTDLAPNIGVTSAPVYDPANGTVYVLAMVQGTSLAYDLFGINPQTGAITFTQPIAGSPTNDPDLTFNASQERQRAGLLLMNGWVYAAFASFCDIGPWVGYVAGVDTTTGASTLWSAESGVTDGQAGIWHSGGGLMSDGAGRIIFSSGNGVSPPVGPGTSPPGQLAESTVRLGVGADGVLTAQDFFSPANAPTLDAIDGDFGSAGPVGLPVGTAAYPHELIQGGKDGRVFVLDRDNLGGRGQGPNGGDAHLFYAGRYGKEFGHPAVYEQSTDPLPANTTGIHDYVYYLGKNDYLRAFQLSARWNGKPALTDVANSTITFGPASGSPVVTSYGTNNSSVVVWAVDSPGETGTGASLQAFAGMPQPVNGSLQLRQIWSAPIGTASKFTIPATSNGMVYVGTRDGRVLGFGATVASLRGAKPLSFGQVAASSAATAPVTLTAAATVTVTGASVTAGTSPGPFTVGQVTETGPGGDHGPVTFPVTLQQGDELHAPVTFSPAGPGGTTGTLRFATRSPAAGQISVPLYGDGTRTGLYAVTPGLSFVRVFSGGMATGPVPAGVPMSQEATIVNGGTAPQTVTSIHPPGGPFSVTGLPARGTVIEPGQSVGVQVTYTPLGTGTSTGSFTVDGSTGTSATVELSGTGQAAVSRFTATPAELDLGRVQAGGKATASVTVTNTGNQPATVTRAALPAAPFQLEREVPRGLPLAGGDSVKLFVSFTPAKPGTVTRVCRFAWSDRLGKHVLDIPVTGTGVAY